MSYGDNPIEKLAQDCLSRATAVQALKTLLNDPALDTPLALGVYGEWGSGKTSVMQMLMNDLPTDSLWVWFDAWQYAQQQEALWRAFLLAVVERLRTDTKLVRLLAQEAIPGNVHPEQQVVQQQQLETELGRLVASLYRSQQYSEEKDWRINWQAAVPLAARAALRIVATTVPGLGAATEFVKTLQKQFAEGKDVEDAMRLVERERVEHYRDQVQSLEQFQHGLRDGIGRYVTKGQRRLYLFIDDLDRCLPEAAVSVLEAIKLFFNIPGCVFILGMDRQVVEQGIRVRYQTFALGPPGTASPVDARQYLDKIIQIPFTLPPLSMAQIAGFIRHWCDEYQQPALKECAEVIVTGVAPNPRSVKRTLNVLRLMLALREAQGQPLTSNDLQRLATIVVLQTSYDALYREVVATPHLLVNLETAARNPAQRSAVSEQLSLYPRLATMLKRGPLFSGLNDDQLADLLFLTRMAA
jgi:KAP family P-loop domain